VAVVVLPIPGGPDNKAALNPAPVSSLPKNLPVIKKNIYLKLIIIQSRV
jgi:hypothetical protein